MTSSGSTSAQEQLVKRLQLAEKFARSGLSRAAFLALHPADRDGLEDMLPEAGDTEAPTLRRLGDFELVRELGRGGMGIVYEALQVSVERRCALKLLRHGGGDERAQVRFRREARFCANLQHPGIVRLVTFGELQGEHYLVMELVEGVALSRVLDALRQHNARPTTTQFWTALDGELARAEFPSHPGSVVARSQEPYVRLIVDLITQIANALDHAHRSGVVHRDIKPANILVRRDGTAMLSDFGVAREEGELGLTQTGEPAGTLHYRAPEQYETAPSALNGLIDVFGLGITLYEALTLRRPFDGETADAVRMEICHARPPDPTRLDSAIDRDLTAILDRALQKDRRDRFATMRGFADDLQRWLERRPVCARPMPFWKRGWRWMGRNRAVTLVIGALAMLTAGLAIALVWVASLSEDNDLLAVGPRLRVWVDDCAALPAPEQGNLVRYQEKYREGQELVRLGKMAGVRAARLDAGQSTRVQPLALVAAQADVVGKTQLIHMEKRAHFVGEELPAWGDVKRDLADIAAHTHLRYRDLNLPPQRGLRYLGTNPETKLLEFWFVPSGSEPRRDAESGKWVIGTETGIVFVLLPPREGDVHCDALFVAAHELTQGQWDRLAVPGDDPPSSLCPDQARGTGDANLMAKNHPVENVTGDVTLAHLRRWGLELPTESEWFYAADLEKTLAAPISQWGNVANLGDRAALESRLGVPPLKEIDDFDDGYQLHAPVGSKAANAYGLYDVVGNVSEWIMATPDNLVIGLFPCAGGGFLSAPYSVREKQTVRPHTKNADIGVRPVRRIR